MTGKTAVLQLTPFLWGAKRALVITPSRLVREQIAEGFSNLGLLRHLGVLRGELTSPKVLVIDELGYLSYSTKAADLLFRVITGRYQSGPTILTTNVPFKDWNTVFPTASCLGALIDRLMHRAEVISIEADSYRKKEAGERKHRKKTPKPSGEKP